MIRNFLLFSFIFSGCVSVTERHLTHIQTHDSIPELERYQGDIVSLHEYAQLYIPSKTYLNKKSVIQLSYHFHTALPYAIHEHEERNAQNPLLVFNSGSGSNAYKIPFENTKRFDQLQEQALRVCIEAGALKNAQIGSIELLSFSAGYGAVREILKNPAHVQKIQRVVLVDSMYAGFTSDFDRTPKQKDIQSFVEFARLAVKGEKELIITYSQVETETYASTAECVQELVKQVGGSFKPMHIHKTDTDRDSGYEMIARFEQKGLHVMGFAGKDAAAHLAHVHSLAEVINLFKRN